MAPIAIHDFLIVAQKSNKLKLAVTIYGMPIVHAQHHSVAYTSIFFS